MKTNFLLASLAATALLSGAITLTAAAQQTRSVSGFEQVKASGAIDVVLTQGSATTVKVDADSDVLASVKTEVQGNTLVLFREQGLLSMLSNKKVTVYITCPRLTAVTVSGASDVKSTTTFTADSFTIQASGASDVTLNLDVKTLSASASGASDLRLTGRADRQKIHLSGSSDYKGYDLQSRAADIHASGASDAYVAVADELQSHTSGSSDVHYRGKPRVSR
ncbi:head GIN domain-containing protein [Hymenobacter perfusus]|uniref:DUF2807 domain-containing protein n=1 Tax=Hymenobacter perfusus TaxID=1236770 RepID=A0A428KIM9_9BACT|nr:head GIN domain-containing protein [Hymenobacter perfusus]RSK46317.1 DUF2807 domain-containing protein [Hymenobacter perfusus]